MNSITFQTRTRFGKIGELLVMLEFLKLGINGVIIGGQNLKHAPDLLLENGIGIEVKTSLYIEQRFPGTWNTGIKKGGWAFAEIKRSNSAILAFVLLNLDFSVYKILYSSPSDFNSTSWNYRKPTELHLKQNRRGPKSKETLIPSFMEENLERYLKIHFGSMPSDTAGQ